MCVALGGPRLRPIKEVHFHYEELSEAKAEAEAKCIDVQSFQDSKWLDDQVGITETVERIPLGEESGYGSFDLDKRTPLWGATVFKHMIPLDEGWLFSLPCHVPSAWNCWKEDLQCTLRFHDVWPMMMRLESGTLEYTDYGGMADYMDQSFRHHDLYLAGKGWKLQDPATNRENGERIVKVWRSIIQSGFQAEDEDGSQARNESAAPPEIR